MIRVVSSLGAWAGLRSMRWSDQKTSMQTSVNVFWTCPDMVTKSYLLYQTNGIFLQSLQAIELITVSSQTYSRANQGKRCLISNILIYIQCLWESCLLQYFKTNFLILAQFTRKRKYYQNIPLHTLSVSRFEVLFLIDDNCISFVTEIQLCWLPLRDT